MTKASAQGAAAEAKVAVAEYDEATVSSMWNPGNSLVEDAEEVVASARAAIKRAEADLAAARDALIMAEAELEEVEANEVEG